MVLSQEQQETGLLGEATAASGLVKGLWAWQGVPSPQDMKGRNPPGSTPSITQVEWAPMRFPAAPVGRAWPPLALPLAVTHRSRHVAQLFCRRRRPPRSSRLAGEATLPPAQSSLARPGFVLQLQPVLLPVLAQLRPKLGPERPG